MSSPHAVLQGSFDLPVLFDLGATFAFGLTGALAGIKRGYDIVGVLALAFVTAIGGGLIRDGLFLVQGPTPLLTNPRYIQAIIAAVDAVGKVVSSSGMEYSNNYVDIVCASPAMA